MICKGSIGEWKIYANVPIFTPKTIKYNWNDGSGTHEIYGDNYTIDENQQIPDYYYLLTWSYSFRQWSEYHSQWFSYNFEDQTMIIKAPFYGFNLINVEDENSPSGISRRLYIRHNGGTLTVNNITKLSDTGYQFDSTYDSLSINLQSLQLFTEYNNEQGLPPPPEVATQYNLKIYNEGNLVYDQTRNIRPTVNFVPETCRFYADKWYLARTFNNYQEDGYAEILHTQYNGEFVSRVLVYQRILFKQNPIPQLLLDVSGQCDYPKIRIECSDCERCPKGTVTKVLNGGKIECYNKNGCIIKTVKYQPNCETYDCVCG